MTERFKFTVYRVTWLRGHRHNGCLLNEYGGRCCLGHLGRDVGIENDLLEDRALPGNVPSPLWPKELGAGKGSLAWDAAIINDDETIADEIREQRLTERFAREGIDVEFKDGAGP